MKKEEINFKLAMADELLGILDRQIEAADKDIASGADAGDNAYVFQKKQWSERLQFFKDILTCKDNETFFDLTSGKPEVKEVI